MLKHYSHQYIYTHIHICKHRTYDKIDTVIRIETKTQRTFTTTGVFLMLLYHIVFIMRITFSLFLFSSILNFQTNRALLLYYLSMLYCFVFTNYAKINRFFFAYEHTCFYLFFFFRITNIFWHFLINNTLKIWSKKNFY